MSLVDEVNVELNQLIKLAKDEHEGKGWVHNNKAHRDTLQLKKYMREVVYDKIKLRDNLKGVLAGAQNQLADNGLNSANLWLDRAKANMVEFSFYKEKIGDYKKKNKLNKNENKAMIAFLQRRMDNLKESILKNLNEEIKDLELRSSLSQHRANRREAALKFIEKIDGYHDLNAGEVVGKIRGTMEEKDKIVGSENIKPGDYVVVPDVDLYEYPTANSKYSSKEDTEITLGDMHGNSVKLLHALVYHEFIHMDKKDYDDFVSLYKKSINIFEYNKSIAEIEKIKNTIQVDSERINTIQVDLEKIKNEEEKIKNEKKIEQINEGITKLKEEIENKSKSIKEPFTQEDTIKFNEIIERIECSNNAGMLRLIGDELADRGANDYFTLKLLEKLNQGNIPFEIMMSNHSMEFLRTYEAGREYTDTLSGSQSRSAEGLQYLIDKNFIEVNTIKKIVDDAYKPNIKAISYTLVGEGDDRRIIIYSHAAIDTNIIQKMSKELELQYKYDGNIDNLVISIDDINKNLKKYIDKNELKNLVEVDHSIKPDAKQIRDDESPNKALVAIIWNRSYEGEKIYKKDDGTFRDPIELERSSNKVSFTYGHDPNGPDQYELNINSTDNIHGKHDKDKDNNKGVYSAYFVDTKAPIPILDINQESLKKLVDSLVNFAIITKNSHFTVYEDVELSQKDEKDIYEMLKLINKCIKRLEALDKEEKPFDELPKILGDLHKKLPLKGEEKIIKSYLDRVARGQEIKYVNFYDGTESDVNPLKKYDSEIQLAQNAEVAAEVAPEKEIELAAEVAPEKKIEPAAEVPPEKEVEQISVNSQSAPVASQETTPKTKKSTGFLEKIKSMFNFSAKIQERKKQKKEAAVLVAEYFDKSDLDALKGQNYNGLRKSASLDEFEKTLNNLDIFSERETKVKNLLPHVKESLKNNNNKFVKQEIRKLEKDIKKSSEKTIQAQIDLIGDYTEFCLKQINTKVVNPGDIKEQIDKYYDIYVELTGKDARKQNMAIEANFYELMTLTSASNSATIKSDSEPQQNESKRRNFIVSSVNAVRGALGKKNKVSQDVEESNQKSDEDRPRRLR